VKLDYKARSYTYRDSLAGTRLPDRHALAALRYWLDTAFALNNTSFTMAQNLPCKRQTNGWSCGIAACTLISSMLGLGECWSPKIALLTRYTWVHRIMKIHLQTAVSCLYFLAPSNAHIVYFDLGNNVLVSRRPRQQLRC
jgi:hypothetical protein